MGEEWMPIKDAPKDGRFILAINGWCEMAVIYWDTGEGDGLDESEEGWVISAAEEEGFPEPTHWMWCPKFNCGGGGE